MESLTEIRDLLRRCKVEGSLDSLKQAMRYTSHADSGIRTNASVVCTMLVKRILLDSFLDMDPDVRQSLVDLLGKLGQDAAALFLRELDSPDPARRVKAVRMLGQITDAREEVVSRLLQLIRNRDEKLRATVASTLGSLVEESDTAALLQMLRDMDERVRANAIEALGSLGNVDLIGILARFRYDPDNRIRANALKALHELGCRDVRPPLDQMIRSDSPDFRASAAWLIGELAQKEPGLLSMLPRMKFSDSTHVRDNMIRALLKIDTATSRAYLDELFTPSQTQEARESSWLQNTNGSPSTKSSEGKRRSA